MATGKAVKDKACLMTSSPPLVSVIIPAYNAQATLGATLSSVQAQTHANLEIIVVDDGSTDKTHELAVAVQAKDSRVRLIRQVNAGVAAARNRAMFEARGEWIAPLDADDLWHPDKLRRQLSRLALNPNAGVCYCWSVDIDLASRVTERRLLVPQFEGWVYEALLLDNFLSNSSSPLIRIGDARSVGGWDATLRDANAQGCEDWDIYLRLARVTPFMLEPGFLVGYRQSETAMSRDIWRMRRSHALVMARQPASCIESFSRSFRYSAALHSLYLGKLALASGRPIAAMTLFLEAAVRAPRMVLTRPVLRDLKKHLLLGGRSATVERSPGDIMFADIDPNLPAMARHIIALRGA